VRASFLFAFEQQQALAEFFLDIAVFVAGRGVLLSQSLLQGEASSIRSTER
jgi:hypothetical protein